MKRRHTNLDGSFSVSSFRKSAFPFFGLQYEPTDSSSSTTISLMYPIKIVFTNLNSILTGKRIISGKLICVFQSLPSPVIFTLKDEFENIIDYIDTSSNASSIKTVDDIVFLTFDISLFLRNNTTNTLYLYNNSPVGLQFYGFNYLDNKNNNSDTPLEYVQINEFHNIGKKDNETFADYDLGNAGIASISLANGNLLFATPTLIGNLVKTSLNISLSYNSLRTDNLTTGYGFRLVTDWQFEIFSNRYVLLTDNTGQELLFEKLQTSIKDALLINSSNDVYYCVENNSYIEVVGSNSYRYHSSEKLEMLFSTSNTKVIISSIIFGDGGVINYSYYDSVPDLLKEIETPDDLISFEYENGLLTKLISNKKYIETTFEYADGYLTLINTFKKKYIPFTNNQMSSELIRSLRLAYDSSTHLLTTADNMIEHRRLHFIYTDNKVITIKESPFDDEANIHIPRDTSLNYSDNVTILTTQSNKPITYCFNSEQKLLYVIDHAGKVINYNYQFSAIDIDGVLSKLSQYALSCNLRNLLTNGSFECSPSISGWIVSNFLHYEQSNDSVYGDCCIFLANDSNSVEKIEQNFEITETNSYTFTGKYKIVNSNVSEYQAKITIQYDEITNIWIPNGDSSGTYTLQETIIPRTIVQIATFELNSGIWKNFEISNLNIPNNANVNIEISIPSQGSLYLDEISLTRTNTIGTNNFVRNSSFETIDEQTNLPYSWIVSGTGISLANFNSLSENSPFDIVLQNKVLKLEASSGPTVRTISQQLYVAGSTGEQLSVHAWLKGNISINEKVKIIVRIHKYNGGSDDFEEVSFSGLNNFDNWQPIGGTLSTNFPYDYIDLTIEFDGYHEIYIDNVQFYKSTSSSHYLYSNNGQLLNQQNGKSSIGTSLNENCKNGAVIGKNNEYLLYEYDNQGREKNVYDNFGNSLNNEYTENGVIKTVSNKGIQIVTSFESTNGLTTRIDELGYTSKSIYDEFGNLISSIDNNGNVIRRLYDDYFRPILVERKTAFESFGKLQIEYTDLNKVSSISVSDGTTYEFNYDDWGRRTSATLNGITIESITHSSLLEFDRSVIVGKQINSDAIYNYSINYQDNTPTSIILNNAEIFSFKYDAFSRLVEWFDVRNDISGFIDYDYSGQIISETLDNGFSYKLNYDNLDNIQSKIIHIFDNTIFYSYLLPYEFNESHLTGYAFNLANVTGNDVVLGSFGIQGLFGLKTSSNQNLLAVDPISGFDVLNFNNKNPIKYSLSTINKKKIASGLTNGSIIQQNLLIMSKKAVSGWFYFDSTSFAKTIIAFEKNSSIKAKITIIGDTLLALTAGETTKYISYNDGLFNKWIMITLNLFGPSALDTNYAKLFINNVEVETINLDRAYLYNLDRLIVGGESTQQDAMRMKVAYLCVGENLFEAELIDRIYKSSLLMLTNRSAGRYKGVTIVNESNENYEYYSLNGTYLSNNGTMPIFVGQQKNSLNHGSNDFSWDDENKRQVYSSFNKTYFLNDASGAFLSYKFPNAIDSFGISIEYCLFTISSNSKRTILALNNSANSNDELSLFYENGSLKISLLNSGNNIVDTISVNSADQQWHKITLKYNNQSLLIFGDSNQLLLTINSLQINLNNLSLFVGCSSQNNEQLNGYLKNLYVCGSNYDLLCVSSNCSSYINKVDAFGRISQIIFNNVSKTYSYLIPKDENGVPISNRTSLKISSETDSFGNNFSYNYDGNGNVTKIVSGNDETTFTYDIADRLKQTEKNSILKEYSYDSNGNILNIQTTQNQIVSNRVFTYDNCGKRLLSIAENNNVIEYQYPNNSFYPIKVGNILLSWEGALLKEIDNGEDVFQYQYDYRNRRISKSTIDSVTHYYYDKEKLVAERTGNDIIFYHYDESSSIVGFTLKTNISSETYFYLKDIFGVIYNIIDSTGQIIASYEYDEFGRLLSSTGNQNIISKNHIIYKGYFYDEETGFYLLGQRYYYPYSCRFISPDDIDYLLANLLDYTQFNLFSYCNNNPLMLSDESGHLIFIITTFLALTLPVLIAASIIAPALGTTIINTTIAAASTAIAAVGALEAFSVIVGIADSAKKNLNFMGSICNTFDAIFDIFVILAKTSTIGIGLGVSLLFHNSNMSNLCLSYFNSTLPTELRNLVEQHYSGLTFLSEFIHFSLTNPLCIIVASCINWIFGFVVGIIDTAYSLTLLISSNNNYEHNKAIWNNHLYQYDQNNPEHKSIPIVTDSINLLNIIPSLHANKIWINEQHQTPFDDFKFGFSTIWSSGCGTIAVFNALQFVQGIDISKFPDLVLDLEMRNLLFEAIGVLPNEIENYLNETIDIQTGLVFGFQTKADLLYAFNEMSEEKVVLPLYFNYSNNVGPDAATSFDQYFSMHYTLLCKKNNNLFYALNNGGSFDDDFLENYWDDTITTGGYRGFLYALIIKKND